MWKLETIIIVIIINNAEITVTLS